MTVLIFLAVLFVLILVHEWGHYIVAKKTDMQVDEFGIGFPPKLYGKKVGETEYTLNALPIGGFVRILGENAEDIAGKAQTPNPRSFVAKSAWAQTAVLIAGVTMNVIFAWFLYVLVLSMGIPTVVEESVATNEASLRVTQVLPESPAAAAGIPIGATITAVSAAETSITELTPSSFQAFVSAQTDAPITITYENGDRDYIATMVPSSNVLASEPDRVLVGVSLALVEVVKQPLHTALYEGAVMTVQGLGAITVGLSSLLKEAVVGQADFSQVAGPVGIAGMVGDAAEFGFTSLLLFTAIISLNLAVINLLPFPALDGGRLVMVGIEVITRRPLNPAWVMRLNVFGFLLLMGLMIAVTYNDILRLL